MNKRNLNLGGIICLFIAIYCIYCLLLRDAPFSISSALMSFNHWASHWHALAVGLLPIYIALVLFGTGMLGIYLGSTLQRWITEFLHNK